jgi:hypothetical protein
MNSCTNRKSPSSGRAPFDGCMTRFRMWLSLVKFDRKRFLSEAGPRGSSFEKTAHCALKISFR